MNSHKPAVRGAKPIETWRNLLADAAGPLHAYLRTLYGDDADLLSEKARLCLGAVNGFAEAFSPAAEVIIVRSAGRVNLLGMHSDHRGGAINTVTIKDVFMVAEGRDDDLVVLRNAEPEQFPDFEFSISECIPACVDDWDTWTHAELEKRRAQGLEGHWSAYVQAAVLYLQNLYFGQGEKPAKKLCGMNVFVLGALPRAAGLSSSSSIVVAAAEASIRINDLDISPEELIDVCGIGEWYVGTRGGRGDHAAIKFGELNKICHIGSFPLSVKPVPFSGEHTIVLCNSLVEAKKSAGARNAFNQRIAEYEFGFRYIRKHFPQHGEKLEYLRDVNPTNLGIDDVGMYEIIRCMPERASREDVLRDLPECREDIERTFAAHDEPPDGYTVRQTCVFGITEMTRSESAVERLEAGDIDGFAEIMNISQNGDRTTRLADGERVRVDNSLSDATIDRCIADLQSGDPGRVEAARVYRQPGGYDVSPVETDEIVDIALSVEGVTAARLVGAGLGGSVAVVVRNEAVDALVEAMCERYYRARGLPEAVEVCSPVGGAGVFDIS